MNCSVPNDGESIHVASLYIDELQITSKFHTFLHSFRQYSSVLLTRSSLP